MSFNSGGNRNWIALGVALALGAACADLERGPRAPGATDAGTSTGGTGADAGGGGTTGGSDTANAAPSFATNVHPLLLTGCQPCHRSGGEAGGTQLLLTGDPTADRATVLAAVDLNSPESSRLLSKAAGTGHQGGVVFAPSSMEYQTILQWIRGGALP